MTILLASLVLCCVTQTVNRISQVDIASHLLAGTDEERADAADLALEIPSDIREPILRDALVRELIRLNEALARRHALLDAGQQNLPPLTFGEYRGTLVTAVAQSTDPKVIPALIGALGTGSIVIRGLAKFGEEAIPAVVAAARNGLPWVVDDGMDTLRLMITSAKDRPLSSESMQTIVEVARSHLYGRQSLAVIAVACELAVSTKDPGLRDRVSQLASDPREAQKLGVAPHDVPVVQRQAARALGSDR